MGLIFEVLLYVSGYYGKKGPPSNYLPGNNYSRSTYLLVNKYSLQEKVFPLTGLEFGISTFKPCRE